MVSPLPASTVLPLRDGPEGLEVMIVRRPLAAGPFGGMWVFPGGRVDPADREVAVSLGVDEWRVAALRELAEEVGIFLTEPVLDSPPVGARGPDLHRRLDFHGSRLAVEDLVYLSNWITPEGVPARFDTRFYAVRVPAGVEGAAVDGEVVGLTWTTPVEAMQRAEAGTWPMIVPTLHHLRILIDLPDTAAVRDLAADEPDPVKPRLVTWEGRVEILLPDQPGYEETTG